MNGMEIRLRCIEALSTSGVRAPSRIIQDAKVLEEWVRGAPEAPRAEPPEKPRAPVGRPRKNAVKE